MRATYQIMSQTNGGKEHIVFTSTRKADTERYFNGLRRDCKKLSGVVLKDVRQGYFTISHYSDFSIFDTDYWICKA